MQYPSKKKKKVRVGCVVMCVCVNKTKHMSAVLKGLCKYVVWVCVNSLPISFLYLFVFLEYNKSAATTTTKVSQLLSVCVSVCQTVPKWLQKSARKCAAKILLVYERVWGVWSWFYDGEI